MTDTPPKNESTEWDSEQGVKRIADFLRGRKGMSVRQAIELGKRVEYFKGDRLAAFLLEKGRKCRACPPIAAKEDAIKVGNALVRYGYIHRSDRDTSSKKKVLTPSASHAFVLDGYYTWMYEGSKTFRNVMTGLLIIGFLGVTCFPIWPNWAKVALWYLSVTFLIVIITFSVIRMLLFFLLWLAGIEFWVLPNIFDDNLSVADSFKPLYSYQKADPKEKYYRFSAMICTALLCAWIYNQPTDFDEYMTLTRQFTDDIYSGKLLTDISQQQKQDIDKVHVPNLEDLMKEEDDEESVQDPSLEDKFTRLEEDDAEENAKFEEIDQES